MKRIGFLVALIGAVCLLTPTSGSANQMDESTLEYLFWSRPGPYRAPLLSNFAIESFGARQKLVAAYFFYWYEAEFLRSIRPTRTFDPYPFKPVNHETMSFHDVNWYLKEFRDMRAAGIDIVLPDYWGEPGQINRRVAPAPELNLFSTQGLAPMSEALATMAANGEPLKVGLFLDTTILNDEDLTTDRGKRIFYATIRNFYSKFPPYLWAAIGGRPIVWLYDAQRVYAFDQSTFDYVNDRFAQDFGGLQPYLVLELQWERSKNVPHDQEIRRDALYSWGAAPFGFNMDPRFTIAQVGPGFSTRQFGRPNFIHTEREGGSFYEYQLQRAVESGRQIMAVETWNELGEASGILETFEYGRLYIDLTRKYADLFKRS